MRHLHIIFLLSVALITSGYKWRCYIFCDEQTGIQNDYVQERDECREYAQSSLDSEMAKLPADQDTPKERQNKLVTLFSTCMARYGWDVPSGSKNKAEAPKITASAPEAPIHVSTTYNPPAVTAAQEPRKQFIIVPQAKTCAITNNKGKKNTRKTNKKAKKDPCEDTAKNQEKTTKSKKTKTDDKATSISESPTTQKSSEPTSIESKPTSHSPKDSQTNAPTIPAPPPSQAAPPTPITTPTIEPSTKHSGNERKSDPAVDMLDSQLKQNFWNR